MEIVGMAHTQLRGEPRVVHEGNQIEREFELFLLLTDADVNCSVDDEGQQDPDVEAEELKQDGARTNPAPWQ